MQILLINGSPHTGGATDKALGICERELSSLGASCVRYNIGTSARFACTGCGGCREGRACVFGDLGELYSLASSSDGIIIGTPVHFGCAPGTLLSVLSRLLISNKAAIDTKPIAAVAVGRRGALSEAASSVLGFFRFTSSVTVNSGYPAIGFFDKTDGALYDAEGEDNMKRTARNIYALARGLDIAKQQKACILGGTGAIKTDIVTLGKRALN